MTAPRKVALADEAVGEAAAEHCRTVQCDDDTFPTEDFIAGARFARDFYEQREALWREYMTAEVATDDPSSTLEEYRRNSARAAELRAALGLERE